MAAAAFSSLRIYHFSGTGNARAAATWMAERAREHGVEVALRDIARLEGEKIEAPAAGELIGFFYPTHGFNAPPVVLKFLGRFPRARNRVFCVNTRAGARLFKLHTPGLSGVALHLPALMLLLKGYRPVGLRPLDMPSNWISIHPALRGKTLDFIHRRCKQTVIRLCDTLHAGGRAYRGLFELPIDLLISPIAFLYYCVGRFALAKTFVSTSDCDDCGLCVKQCPVNAIEKHAGRLYWKFSCESCMRCMNNCHKSAIETAHGSTVLLWWLCFSTLPYWLGKTAVAEFYARWLPSQRAVGLLLEVIEIGIGMLALFVGYWGLHLLMKIGPFNRLVAWTSLTHLPFWGRYRLTRKQLRKI